MARAKPRKSSASSSAMKEIGVSKLRNINIHFPGDVYTLAVWVANSNNARSTPTSRRGTTLHGLANKFAAIYNPEFEKPLSSDDVMAVFRAHGIDKNSIIRLDQDIADEMHSSEIREPLNGTLAEYIP